jgi:predicted permease
VEAALERIAATLAVDDSSRGAGWTLHTYDASAGLPAGAEKQILPLASLALAVTVLVLLICCANVSNLMLARALGRGREIATRLSIGASRLRVVRQLVTEAVVLALMASAVGLLLATWGTDLLIASTLPLPLDLSVDWRVFAVSASLALVTGIVFGLAPALHATRGGTGAVLRQSATGGDRRRSRLQGGLVVAQVAFSLLLLTMSGLFLRSLDKAQRIDVGFDASPQVLAVSFDLGLQRYDSVRAGAFREELTARARALPGVESVSFTTLLPLTEWSSTTVVTQGEVGEAVSAELRVSSSVVAPDYFRTIGQPMVTGRDFTGEDGPSAPLVAIVSERFATRHLAGTPAIGARISMDGAAGPWRTVVGVVRDAVVQSLHAPAADGVYVPLGQQPSGALTLLVRTRASDAGTLAPALRDAIRVMDPTLPVFRQLTLDQVRAAATAEQRNGATVLAIFGALALLLAAIGLHGVMLFTVRQRTREIGIRIALGATKRAVIAMFVGRGVRLTLVGGAVGVVLALGATQLLRSMLFGIAPTDAITFVAVSVLFLVVALAASWMPARRAARIDPVVAMGAE